MAGTRAIATPQSASEWVLRQMCVGLPFFRIGTSAMSKRHVTVSGPPEWRRSCRGRWRLIVAAADGGSACYMAKSRVPSFTKIMNATKPTRITRIVTIICVLSFMRLSIELRCFARARYWDVRLFAACRPAIWCREHQRPTIAPRPSRRASAGWSRSGRKMPR